MTSYKPEVTTDGKNWAGNGLRFATEREALDYVKDLEWRWNSVRGTRVVESDDVVSHIWHEGRVQPAEVKP